MERCGRPIEFVSFYADVVSDALVLPNSTSKSIAYSVLEAIRQGAAEILEMEVSDLQILVFGKQGSEEVTGLLYDPMPGGSGLLDQILKRWREVVKAATAIATNCASACESSCIDCLQHFRNAFYHDSLDRHVARECFVAWGEELSMSHDIPPQLPDDKLAQKPTNDPELHLVRMLKSAGLDGFETERPIKLSGGIVTRPDVYFDVPNDHYEGVCIYLDGMSAHIHGNHETAAKDRLIREELRSKDYEVIEVMYQQLFDKVMMRQHMRRIARTILGREKAKKLDEDDSWFG
jgi:hypothetical protein